MNQPAVTFQIDGVDYESAERRMTAAALIALAGLDPESHDLLQVSGSSDHQKRLNDDDSVQLTPGAAFLTVFTGPTPVV